MPGGSAKRLQTLGGPAILLVAALVPAWASAQSALPPYGATAPGPPSALGNGVQGGVASPPLLRGTADADAPPPAPLPGSQPADSPINYGRPRPKKPVLYAPDPRASRPLPPLVPYPTAGPRRRSPPYAATANGSAARGTTPLPPAAAANVTPSFPPPAAQPPAGPTVLAIPIIDRRARPKPDDTPFAPTGVDVGSLRLSPFVETGLGYDTNPNRVYAGVRSSPFAEVNGGLGIQSQWSQHSLTADLRGGYDDYFRNHPADRPNGAGKIDGRIDVTRDTQIDVEARYLLATQTPGSAQLAIPGSTTITNRPTVLSFGGGVGVTQTVNRLKLSLQANVDRTQSQDGVLSDGTALRLSTTDFNDYGLTARAGYELSPGFVPFVDVTADTRKHDDYYDYTGFARDSVGVQARIGTTYEATRLLTGDVAFGYADRHYVDPRLNNLRGPTIDGSLAYALTPLTTVSARASTTLAETTQAYTSGAISRSVSLQVAHALFRNFTLTGIATYTNNNYRGQPIVENVYAASLRAEYSLTRDIVLKASYTHEQLASNLAFSSYKADVFLAGIRLQR